MKSVQLLVAALLLVASPVILADKPDPELPNPPLRVWVEGGVVEVINAGASALMVSEGPYYGYKVAQNRGCNVSFASDRSSLCSPGGFKPQVIEQVSVKAHLSGVSEGILFIKIIDANNPVTIFEHSVPLKAVNGILFGSQLTRLYVPEGFVVNFEVVLDTAISAGAARIDFSGYSVMVD